eukprot:g5039.t1
MWNSKILNRVVILSLLRLAAVLLFCRGYLLSRRELPSHSSCGEFVRHSTNNLTSIENCWIVPSYDRLILLVIDGLRFDCVLDEECPTRISRPPHIGQFPKLTHWIRKGKGASLLFKFIADPPTSTTTRLKAMMTGGLPTLFDVGNTFSGREVTEDNFLSQLKAQGKRIAFVGDDTWHALFSNELDTSIPYPSFDVQDLDTVDDGVRKNFYPIVLERPEMWDVAIGHYLGVDHSGHVFGVPSTQTAEKLKTMDDDISHFLEQLIKSETLQQDRSLLLVFGDHAMTLSGDHGSGSKDEVETVLFAFDIQRLKDSRPLEFVKEESSYCIEDYEVHRLDQIDFAATLAALMDVPIPYGSIGQISKELFNLGSFDQERSSLKHALKANAWQVSEVKDAFSLKGYLQVNQYLNDYSQLASRSFRKNLESINDVYKKLEDSNSHLREFDHYFEKASSFAKIHWTRFDDVSILIGLCLFFLTLPLQVYLFNLPVLDGKLIVPNGVVLLHGLFFFSDSFINNESRATSFFIATLALWMIWNYLKSELNITNQMEISLFVVTCLISNSILSAFVQEWKSIISGLLWNSLTVTGGILALYGLKSMISDGRNQLLVRAAKGSDKFCLLLLRVQFAMVGFYWTLALLVPDQSPFRVTIAQAIYLCSILSFPIIASFCILDSGFVFPVMLLSNLLPPMLVVSGEKGSVVLFLTLILVTQFKRVLFQSMVKMHRSVKWYLLGIICHYGASQVFYLTGHFCKFSGLNFNAAFHGLTEFYFYFSGLLLALETFTGYIFFTLLFPHFAPAPDALQHTISGFSLTRNYLLFLGMLSGNIMRRHLFSVETFAPKMLFELSISGVCETLTLISSFLM